MEAESFIFLLSECTKRYQYKPCISKNSRELCLLTIYVLKKGHNN